MNMKRKTGEYTQQTTEYKAFIPLPLPSQESIKIEGELQEKLALADRSLARLDGLSVSLSASAANKKLFISMYEKKEALTSSQIEGTEATMSDILEFEGGMKVTNETDVKEVLNYIEALDYGIDKLDELPISSRLIREMHKILMQDVRGKHKDPGYFRKTQNWIGPKGCSLKNAAFIPPPPQEIPNCIAQLENYINEHKTTTPLVDCALIHYQFETIHPFLDGNGRIGRLLIILYLYWKKILSQPLLYLSSYFKKHQQEYYQRLNEARLDGKFEEWIIFFLNGISNSAESAVNVGQKIINLYNEHMSLLRNLQLPSRNAVFLLQNLFENPYVTIRDVEKEFSISFPSASKLVTAFVKAGILYENTGKERRRFFTYKNYIDLFTTENV